MNDKSHVAMGFEVCPVCGIKHNEAVVLDKKLKASLPSSVFLGYTLCDEHKKQLDEGYVFLIEVKDDPSDKTRIKMEEADRLGGIMAVRKEAFQQIFNDQPPEVMAFIEHSAFKEIHEHVTQQFPPIEEIPCSPTVH